MFVALLKIPLLEQELKEQTHIAKSSTQARISLIVFFMVFVSLYILLSSYPMSVK